MVLDAVETCVTCYTTFYCAHLHNNDNNILNNENVLMNDDNNNNNNIYEYYNYYFALRCLRRTTLPNYVYHHYDHSFHSVSCCN